MRLIAMLTLACMTVSPWATATVLRVPDEHATIQEAIDAAQPGDVIEIAPGTYTETLTLTTSDLSLKGGGAESCVISPGYLDGIPLTVKAATGVSVSGLTLRHGDVEDLPQERKEWPDGLYVEGAEVVAENCHFGPTAGCGAVARAGAKVTLVGCDASGNPQMGVLAFDAGTELWARNGTFSKNDYGAYARNGGTLTLTDCTCRENKRDGVFVKHHGTQLAVQGGLFEENGHDGLKVVFQAAVELQGCEARANKNYGIIANTGGRVEADGVKCDENEWSGIAAVALTTSVRVHSSSCDGNKSDGISVFKGAEAFVSNSHCEGNGGAGLTVSQLDSKVTAEGNRFVGNTDYGVSVFLSARADLRNNICSGSQCGLQISDEGSEATLHGNTYSANSVVALNHRKGRPLEEQDQTDSNVLCWLLYLEEFDRLEWHATRYREMNGHWDNGCSFLDWVYDRLEQGYASKNYNQREIWEQLMDRWRKARPDSITPRVLLARGYIHWAWEARGSDYAHTVTEEGWRRFHRDIAQARRILEETEALDAGDPELYSLLGTIARAEHWPEDRLLAVCAKGLAIDPYCDDLLDEGTWYYLPRYYGHPGDIARFGEWACDAVDGKRGLAPYARVAAETIRVEDTEALLAFHAFDWEKLRIGFPELLEEFPRNRAALHAYCKAACLYGERELALELFERIGDDTEHRVWKEGEFHRWKSWAHGIGERPDTGGNIPTVNLAFSGVKRYAYDLLVFLCALIVVNGILLGVFLMTRHRRRRKMGPPESG